MATFPLRKLSAFSRSTFKADPKTSSVAKKNKNLLQKFYNHPIFTELKEEADYEKEITFVPIDISKKISKRYICPEPKEYIKNFDDFNKSDLQQTLEEIKKIKKKYRSKKKQETKKVEPEMKSYGDLVTGLFS
ncbi:MAG: hypothetical protein GY900_12515 [Actinomycetia bacterium]|nr:hypothetical protein [Actinomycetes bacterium]